MNNLLTITNLAVNVGDTPVVRDVSLAVAPGTMHAIMGPNGSGKSSLAHTILGNPAYRIAHGTIMHNGILINDMAVHKRAQAGIFVGFQYPVELPGVLVSTFLHESYQACTGTRMSVIEFKELLEDTMELLGIDQAWAQRCVNVGFSGGEKKMFELLHMVLVQPRCAILDEIDSGLDIDALKKIAAGIALAREENPHMSCVIITHYQRILQYVIPDMVHIMYAGRLVDSGTFQLAHTIEQQGYHGYRI